MNRVLPFLPLLALIVVVAIGGFLLTRRAQPEHFTAGMIGQAAPSYTLPRLGGGEAVTSEATHGRAHLVNLFASWCTPCRAEHGALMALQAGGVEIVGVAYKDEAEDTARYIAELGDPYSAIGMDRDGQLGLQFGATGAPETYVIGADGMVKAVYRGPLTREVIDRTIMPALHGR